ncbi:MAG: glycosyltransferase [Deltaproteobacteria bacterium]|nr:glycosyltransferase [Deltaproteobacteria bacterium]
MRDVLRSAPRILFISPQPFMADRGSPLRVKNTVEVITSFGFEVDLLSYPLGSDVCINGVRIYRGFKIPLVKKVPIGPSFRKCALDLALFFRAMSLPRKNAYVAIHGIEEAAIIAATLARKHEIPYFMDMHSAMREQLEKSRFYGSPPIVQRFDKIEAWCIRNSSGVVTVADAMTERSRSIAPKVPAYTATDLPFSSEVPHTSYLESRIRRELNLDDAKLMLYTGNLASYQGIEFLIRAFANYCSRQSETACDKQKKRVVLAIVGGGTEEERTLLSYMALAQKLGVADDVRFLGFKPSSEVPHYLQVADILVSPRLSGSNTPLKIYSYMAAEKPILASRILSHTQVLSDECSYLFDLDEESFCEALTQSLDSSAIAFARRKQLIQKSKELVETRFGFANFRQALYELYKPIMHLVDVEALSSFDNSQQVAYASES